MKDRQPYPGKEGMVKLTLTNGQVLEGKLEMADDPLEPGDPLNKATLLKDATAALFGLGTDAVPDDVLAFLGKYNQYWWRRRINTVGWTVKTSEQSVNSVWESHNDADGNIEYSSEIDISDGGVVSLKNPSFASFNRNRYSDLNVVKGKYWTCDTVSLEDAGILYTPSNAPNAKLRSYSDYYAIEMQYGKVTSEYTGSIGEWEYLWSPDRNTYPDSGISESYEYQFLGIPLSNAATAPKISSGYFVGTGTHNKSNPNSLKFDFKPAFVIVQPERDFSLEILVMLYGVTATGMNTGSGLASAQVQITWEHTTVSWYHDGEAGDSGSPTDDEGTKYYYFAVGI